MSKKEKPEILYFSEGYADIFMQAVKNASKKTMISNNSIKKIDEREVQIYPTRSGFLIEVGQQYEKLIKG